MRVTGTVRGETGAVSTAQNVQVELFPAYESYAGALRRLTEKQAPAPLATARVGAGGTYEILAPEKGCFRVVVRAEGYLPVEIPFLPLVEHLELPTAPLGKGEGKQPSLPWIRVEEPPAADARIRIEVRDAKGQPAPRALVRRGGLPIAVTGQDGRLEIAVPWNGPPLTVESREGEQARIAVSAPIPIRIDGSKAVPVRLEPLRQIAGQVVNAQTRKPVSGALVWNGQPLDAAPVQAGKDGKFQIGLPSWAAGKLEGMALGFEQGESRMDGKAPPEPVVLPLSPSTSLYGLVVDPEDRPVPGTLVVATPPRVRNGVPELIRARTSEKGRFVLRGLTPNGTYSLKFTRQGFSQMVARVQTKPTLRTPVFRFVIPEGPAVTGRMVDEDGQPVQGAEVTLSLRPSGEAFQEGGQWSAASGPDGRFQVPRANSGTFSLTAVHPDHADLHMPYVYIPGARKAVDLGTLTLPAGGAIEGKVTDTSGKPLEGAEVTIKTGTVTPSSDQFPELVVRTEADGAFRARGLRRSDSFSVTAWSQGYVPATLYRVKAPPETPVRIELKPLRGLSGRVTGSEGEPVAGAEVVARSSGWHQGYRIEARGVTDAQGGFRLTGLAPGSVSLKASADGYLDYWLFNGPQIPEGGELEGVEVVLQRGRILEARVRDAGGEPVPSARVEARCEGGFISHPCTTDLQGRCRLHAQAGLPCAVSAERKEYSAMSGPETFASRVGLPPGTGETQVELRLPPRVEVSGRVIAEDGTGVSGIAVGIRELRLQTGGVSMVRTEADGSFLIPGLPDGVYALTVSRNQAYAEAEITVEGQPVRGVELRMGREETPATLTGRVLGVPPAELSRVWILVQNASGSHEGWVEPGGTYRVEGLLPGEWGLDAGSPGGELSTSIFISPGQTAVTVDLEIENYRKVAGRVLLDGEPLKGATVEVLNGEEQLTSTLSNNDGTFHLLFTDREEPGAGLYRIKAEKEGIAPAEVSVAIPEGEGAPPVEIHLTSEDETGRAVSSRLEISTAVRQDHRR